jgi:hypothetical protein
VTRQRPAVRWLSAALLCGAVAALAGCAGPVRTVSLATSQPDTPAYELNGPTLAHLRAEATRRCPQGFQVLRAAEAGERRGAPDAGFVSRWMTRGVDAVMPPAQTAQMMVLCQPAAGSDRVAGRDSAGGAERPAALPGGTAGKPAASSTAAVQPRPQPAALAGIELPPPSQAPVSGYQ